MLYFATALYEEAAPFIQYYSLKQDTSLLPFEIFKNENVLLLVTKPGALRAAIALSHLFTLFPPEKNDFFLSVGTAACAAEHIAVGSPFLIHKITDAVTRRTQHPELLFTSPFPEAALTTVPTVLTELPDSSTEAVQAAFTENAFPTAPLLYDMEGFAIYETAAAYFDTHQFALLRIVSDHMHDLSQLSPVRLRERVTAIIQNQTPLLCSWLAALMPLLPKANLMNTEELDFLQRTSERLCCSVSMQNSLKQLMNYLHQNVPDYLDSLRTYLDTIQPLPCSCRKEGKLTLERLRNHFL